MTKDVIRVCGIALVRAPAHENPRGRWDCFKYRNGMTLTIRIDTLRARFSCVIDVGTTKDSGQFRSFHLCATGRSKRAALLTALDLVKYPLAVAGFKDVHP